MVQNSIPIRMVLMMEILMTERGLLRTTADSQTMTEKTATTKHWKTERKTRTIQEVTMQAQKNQEARGETTQVPTTGMGTVTAMDLLTRTEVMNLMEKTATTLTKRHWKTAMKWKNPEVPAGMAKATETVMAKKPSLANNSTTA